jgi:hypothetical protein
VAAVVVVAAVAVAAAVVVAMSAAVEVREQLIDGSESWFPGSVPPETLFWGSLVVRTTGSWMHFDVCRACRMHNNSVRLGMLVDCGRLYMLVHVCARSVQIFARLWTFVDVCGHCGR